MPLRTTARITAFRPGQSPPPVNIAIFIFAPICLLQYRFSTAMSSDESNLGLTPARGLRRQPETQEQQSPGRTRLSPKGGNLTNGRGRQRPVLVADVTNSLVRNGHSLRRC